MKKNNFFERNGDDALAPLRLCLKVLRAWPENQTKLQRFISYLHYPIYSVITIPFMVWYIISDGPDDGPINIIRALSDTIGLSTFVVRGTLILYYVPNVYRISELTTKGCKEYEENHKVVKITPSKFMWCPSIAFLTQLVTSFIVCFSSLVRLDEERKASVPMSKTALSFDFIFYPLLTIFTFGHIPVWLTITSSDAMIVSLSTTIREKAETMKNIIGDLTKIRNNDKRDAELTKIVKYHNIICFIRNETEMIFSYAMLLQLLFLVISLGSPGIRLLYTTMTAADLQFTFCYVLWVVTQLVVYCEVCEAATHACTSVGFAAYSVYQPDMSPQVCRKLIMIILRSQRPMDLTARKIIKINRQTLLKICRRSYSLYSAILKLR